MGQLRLVRPGQDDELASCVAGFHERMGFADLVEHEDPVDRDDGSPRGDVVEEGLKYGCWKIVGLAAVRREPDTAREVADRVEVLDDPLVAEHPGEADDAVDPHRRQRVGERGCADQLERAVHAIGIEGSRL
jgi:hypothetical protein